MEITYKNHVPELAKIKKMNWMTFKRQAYIDTGLTFPTLAKAYNGDTDLSLDTVVRLAHFFGVSVEEVIEPVIKNGKP